MTLQNFAIALMEGKIPPKNTRPYYPVIKTKQKYKKRIAFPKVEIDGVKFMFIWKEYTKTTFY